MTGKSVSFGIVCDDNVPYDQLQPGDVFSALPSAEIIEKWNRVAAISVSLRGFGPWKVDPPPTVTRIRVIRSESLK